MASRTIDSENFNKALELQRAGLLDDAAALYRSFCATGGPLSGQARINLAVMLDEQGRHEEALQKYREVLAHQGRSSLVLNNMGNSLMKLGRFSEAVESYRQALALAPECLEARLGLGAALQREGDAAGAVACFREALRRQPDSAEAHWNLALALLISGEFREGWREYEWRWRRGSFTSPQRHFRQPLWDGSPLGGRRLLIHAEQGLGDTLQFARYLPLAASAGGKVIVECQSWSLRALLQGIRGISAVYAMGERLPEFDLQAPLLSLPYIFGTTLETVPGDVPYLSVDPDCVASWGRRIGASDSLKVGIVWSGKPLPDPFRSCPLQELAPLGNIPGVTFFSLQVPAIPAERCGPLNLVDHTAHIADFADTAALVSLLDLVISIDTSVAHLAGALAKPVWLLLPKAGDYRWLLRREDSPWYPTMRIFRQDVQGEWGAVIERVADSLRKKAAEGKSFTTEDTGEKLAQRGTGETNFLGGKPISLTGFLCESSVSSVVSAFSLGVAAQLSPESAASATSEVQLQNDAGCALDDAGRHAEAVEVYRRAISLQPYFMPLHYNLGNSLKALGRSGQAAQSYRRALALDPSLPQGWHNLALALQDLGQLEEAKHALERALLLRPDYLEARHNLGELWHRLGDLATAERCFRDVLAAESCYLPSWNSLGIALQAQERLEEAVDCYLKALTIDPEYPHALNNLGAASKSLGMPERAAECYLKVLGVDPQYADARWNLALVQLLLGRYREGWEGYEWRFRKVDPVVEQKLPQPRWDGAALNGRTILIHAEQGFGDTIQFVRYATVLARMGGRVVVQCQSAAVAAVVATVPGVARVVVRGEPLPQFDVHAPLMSLPLLCRTELITIPAEIPYMRADRALTRSWGGRMRSQGLRVGLVWAGRKSYGDDGIRSLTLGKFAPLASVAGVRFFSLQVGAGAEQVVSPPPGLRITDLGSGVATFADTAAIIENLDLVISVDTAVAHLAGALGRPVWVLLPMDCDWRWLLEREDSPWYPTARLFRQRRRGDWAEVLERVARELKKVAVVASVSLGADFPHPPLRGTFSRGEKDRVPSPSGRGLG
jgi:tetratricopeptide (TPR) repeat protein